MSWNPQEHYQEIDVAEQYDSARFDSLAGRVFNALERRILTRVFGTLPAGARVADVPCGTGRLAEILLELGLRVTGMDISPAMLAVARRRLARFGDRFDTVVANARELERPDQPYDAVLCARVLMHFPLRQQIEFLSHVARLTDGPVVINQSYSSPYQALRRRVKRVLRHQTSTNHPVTENEIAQLLDGSGLRELRRHRILPPISEAIFLVATGR
jgi:ubiquinone/menaquinone biosynthesis C-methylase UbiE